MFERFTELARQVVVDAQDEARALRHAYIGPEHILLGLIRQGDGLAAHVLESLDVTYGEARAQVERLVGVGDTEIAGQIPFTPRSKKVQELALREALSLGHNYIGTEHLLLGLVRENEGVATRILLDFDADAEKIRNAIHRCLSGNARRASAMRDVKVVFTGEPRISMADAQAFLHSVFAEALKWVRTDASPDEREAGLKAALHILVDGVPPATAVFNLGGREFAQTVHLMCLAERLEELARDLRASLKDQGHPHSQTERAGSPDNEGA